MVKRAWVNLMPNYLGHGIAKGLANVGGTLGKALLGRTLKKEEGRDDLLNKLAQLRVAQQIEDESPKGKAKIDLLLAQVDATRALAKQRGQGGTIKLKEKEALIGLESTNQDIDSLATNQINIPAGFVGGGAEKVKAFTKGFTQEGGLSAGRVGEFDSLKSLMMSNIARNLGGERGVLTDQDLKRIEAGFPQITDSEIEREKKIGNLKNFIERRVNLRIRGELPLGIGVPEKTGLKGMSEDELLELLNTLE